MKTIPIWKSYVWHHEICFFVSTIERDYDTYEGLMRGQETMVWRYDWDKRERIGDLILQVCTPGEHQNICRQFILYGDYQESRLNL